MHRIPKRKVQAQRKFAQGAYIPPANNITSVRFSGLNEAVPQVQENIIQNSISAKNVLDIVSFQSIHTHLQPVVLLERLAPGIEAPKHNGHEFSLDIQPQPSTSSEKIPPDAHSDPEEKNGPVRKNGTLKRKSSKIKPRDKNMRSFGKSKSDNACDSSSGTTDDERPLKYLKTCQREPSPSPEKEVRITRSATKIKRPSGVFKEPAVPTRFSMSSFPIAKQAKKVKTTNTADKFNRQYYGSKGIARWLNSHESRNEPNDIATPETVSNNSVRANSPCPSESMRTVRDVVDASHDLLARCCANCAHCERVAVVKKLATILFPNGQHLVNPSDVFEFTEDETAIILPSYCHQRKRQCTHAQDTLTQETHAQVRRTQATCAREVCAQDTHAQDTHPQSTRAQETRGRKTRTQKTRVRETRIRETRAQEKRARETRSQETLSRKTRSRETRSRETRSRETRSRETRSRETRAQDTRARGTHAHKTLTQETLTQKTVAEEALAQGTRTPKLQTQETRAPYVFAQEALAYEILIQDTLDQETIVQNKDDQETRAQETSAQETHAQDTFAQETLAQEKITQETQTSETQIQENSTPTASGIGEENLYLDLVHDGKTIVEIKRIIVPKTGKKFMKARVMPKSEATAAGDISLVEHENLLEQLLEALTAANAGVSSHGGTQQNTERAPSQNKANLAPTQIKTNLAPTQADTNLAPTQHKTILAPIKTETDLAPIKNETDLAPTKNKTNLARTRNETNILPTKNESNLAQIKNAINLALTQKETDLATTKDQTNLAPTQNVKNCALTQTDTNCAPIHNEIEHAPTAPAHNTLSTMDDNAKFVEAPIFYPTEAEFNDPIKFFEKIAPTASKYGLCKIVAPNSFKPKCVLSDAIKFNVANNYIGRLYSRWGPATRRMCAIKAYLATQNITFSRVPLLDGLEVNLSKLYTGVQRNGGLKQVIEKKRWGRVAEEMGFAKGSKAEKMLDSYYVKYLLPYETATNQERLQISNAVDSMWAKRHRKLIGWSVNPLHLQKKLLGESDSSDEEISDASRAVLRAVQEAEDCVVQGRPMNLSGFKKVAGAAMSMYIGREDVTAKDIEAEYWRLVVLGNEHVCVNAASIDTTSGSGFSKNKSDPGARHPWNLKMLSLNSGNVLRSMGAVLGVTVPTLHLAMVFSTSCWHRDPHGLPWMEYMHEGPSKIWYGIPDEQSANFRRAVEKLCPTLCQSKDIWLSSDITMIPPILLREHSVSLSHVVQNPGEYIVVFPKAYSCSISTGFTVSESVYFATDSWLDTVHDVFKELRSSCEPTTFSLEQLLLALARDPRSSLGILQKVHSILTTIVDDELRMRRELTQLGVQTRICRHPKKYTTSVWNVRELAECQYCRTTLYVSKVTGAIGRNRALCLLHALRLLETPRGRDCDVTAMELSIFFSEQQLQEDIKFIQSRLLH